MVLCPTLILIPANLELLSTCSLHVVLYSDMSLSAKKQSISHNAILSVVVHRLKAGCAY